MPRGPATARPTVREPPPSAQPVRRSSCPNFSSSPVSDAMPSRAPRSTPSTRPRPRRSGAVAKAGVADVDAASAAPRAPSTTGPGPARRPPTAAGCCCPGRRRCSASAARSSPSPRPAAPATPSATPGGRSGAAAATFEFYAGAANKHHGGWCPCRTTASTWCSASRSASAPSSCRGTSRCSSPAGRRRPALAAGNPVILKPASLTPLTALLLGDLLVEAGVPPECVIGAPRSGRHRSATRSSPTAGSPRSSFTGETTTGAVDPQGRRPTTSPGCRSSSAASRPASCSPTPTSSAPRPTPRWPCSATPVRTAAPRSRILVERSAYDDFVAAFAGGHRAHHASARRSTRPPRWAR